MADLSGWTLTVDGCSAESEQMTVEQWEQRFKAFDPDQPRYPAGAPGGHGGEWMDVPGRWHDQPGEGEWQGFGDSLFEGQTRAAGSHLWHITDDPNLAEDWDWRVRGEPIPETGTTLPRAYGGLVHLTDPESISNWNESWTGDRRYAVEVEILREAVGRQVRPGWHEWRVDSADTRAVRQIPIEDVPGRKDFDPSQPRDPHTGEWIETGAGAVAALKGLGYTDVAEVEFPTGKKVVVGVMPESERPSYERTTQLWVVDDPENFDPEVDDPKAVDEWLYDLSDWDLDDYIPEQDFSEDFWNGVPDEGAIFYHGTTSEHREGIEADGLQARSETRGLTNRSTGAAVFLHPDSEYAEQFYASVGSGYGSDRGLVVAVDLSAMKRDGVKPTVGGEEPLSEAAKRDSVAYELGLDGFHDDAADYDGLDPETLIVYGDIDPKYLEFETVPHPFPSGSPVP